MDLKYPMGRCEEESQTLLSGAQGQGERHWEQTEIHNISFKH